MSTLVADMPQTTARDTSRASGWRIDILQDWAQAEALWPAAADFHQTPFQHLQWLKAWYGAFANGAGLTPVIAVIRDDATSELVALFPLIRRRVRGLRLVEFADLDLTDYNTPLLGPAVPRDAASATHLWRALRKALRRMPGGADLIRLRKFPAEWRGTHNPLALIAGARPCPLNGNVVVTGDDFDAYRYSLERTVRKELERSWRVFTREPHARFEIVTDPARAQQVLAVIEAQQGARMDHLGLNFILNDDTAAAFYRTLVRDGIAEGYAVVSALTCGDEVVAALLGIRQNGRYIMVRISNAGGRWTNCSPGRLIIERTMAALHAEGFREFDFSIGNYAYKRRFGVTPIALMDLTAALGLRGVPHALRDAAVQWLRHHPRLFTRLQTLTGRTPSREDY